jgi:hypothetical protein
MKEETQTGGPTKTVRIYVPVKNDLAELIIDKQSVERRTITEAQEVSKAVKKYVKSERKKLERAKTL